MSDNILLQCIAILINTITTHEGLPTLSSPAPIYSHLGHLAKRSTYLDICMTASMDAYAGWIIMPSIILQKEPSCQLGNDCTVGSLAGLWGDASWVETNTTYRYEYSKKNYKPYKSGKQQREGWKAKNKEKSRWREFQADVPSFLISLQQVGVFKGGKFDLIWRGQQYLMQFQRITTKDKLLFLPKPVQQVCVVHLAPAVCFCARINCQLYTYLCQRCLRQNVHGHTDEIYDFAAWIQKMTERLGNARTSSSRLFQSVSEGRGDFKRFVTELRRVLDLVERLQAQVGELIRESKSRLIGYIRKYEGFSQNKLSGKAHLYSNPYLFVGKVNSERNDDFVQSLKKCMRGDSLELIDGFNPKYEVVTLQGKLKKLLEGSSGELFNPSKEAEPLRIRPFQQRIVGCQARPDRLFLKGDKLILGLKGLTHIYRLKKSHSVDERLAVTMAKCSAITTQDALNFIGAARDSKELVQSFGGKLESATFQFRIHSLLLINHGGKFFGLLGRDQGKITIFDLQNNTIIATLQEAHNSKVEHIQLWESGGCVLCCGRNTPVSLYKLVYLPEEVSLQFQQQLALPLSEIRMIQVYGSFLVGLLQGRGVVVFDLVLRVQYRSIGGQACGDFDLAGLVLDNQERLVFSTHNEGENQISIWYVEKHKPEVIRCERLNLLQKQQLRILQLCGSEVWLSRPQQGERRLYNFNLQVG